MHDIGVSCKKSSVRRNQGTRVECEEGKERSNGKCFDPCPEGSHGKGNTCWGGCPIGTVKCGDLLCLSPELDCTGYIMKDVIDVAKTIGDIAGSASGGFTPGFASATSDMASEVVDYSFPVCNWEESLVNNFINQ